MLTSVETLNLEGGVGGFEGLEHSHNQSAFSHALKSINNINGWLKMKQNFSKRISGSGSFTGGPVTRMHFPGTAIVLFLGLSGRKRPCRRHGDFSFFGVKFFKALGFPAVNISSSSQDLIHKI